MSGFTEEEKKAISGLKRAFRKIPKTLRLIVCDDAMIICKEGLPSCDVYENVLSTGVHAGIGPTDLHDDLDYGEYTSSIEVCR